MSEVVCVLDTISTDDMSDRNNVTWGDWRNERFRPRIGSDFEASLQRIELVRNDFNEVTGVQCGLVGDDGQD
jgi:hypothetical protein